ncbi:hypothetical protein [Pseudomonas oryzihabitans]|uniref:DUF2635 domain-containing protein n=1 Tax=Pseudomonas oryzihabitans TaxID=47885 RepID=A0A178LK18_9PSED|nr:hypothetical protein [Pseudomonas oryzihabitans]OAN31147.1 hypothetical protein A4V15_14160 [Pseudomonas oryzihabitans]
MRVIAAEYPVPLLPTRDDPLGGFIQPAPAEPVEVPEHSYYLRRVATGELLRAPAAKADAKVTVSTKPAKATKAEPAATEDTPQ